MTIRKVHLNDLQDWLKLMRAFRQEAVLFHHLNVENISEEALIRWFLVMADEPKCYIRVVVDQGEIIGTVAGELVPYRMCFNMYYASDDFFYVRKDKRGSRCFVMMIRDFEDWAWNHGAREVRLSASANSLVNNEKAAKMCQKLGYSPVGYIVRKTQPAKEN